MVSLIIPVYNVENCLRKCIESVLLLQYSDFELILVDDGSTDSSGKICDEYSEVDSRVKVIHKRNGGVSSARNLGMMESKGEWIGFIDADDWIDSEYLSVLCPDSDCDMSVCSYYWETTEGSDKDLIETAEVTGNFKNEFLKKYLPSIHFSVVWAKLYKKDIIIKNGLRFNQNFNSGEDTLFVLEYLTHVNSLKSSNKPLYHYNRSNSSLSNDNRRIYEEFDRYSCELISATRGLSKFDIDSSDLVCELMSGPFYKSILYLQHELDIKFSSIERLNNFLKNPVARMIVGHDKYLPQGDRGMTFDCLASKKNRVAIIFIMLLIKVRIIIFGCK